MEFAHRAFPKIGEATSSASAADWVATEKIHGAQLVVGIRSDEVRIGKRKAWLTPAEPFFGWQLLRTQLTSAARALSSRLGARQLWMYGELFGGGYPHPDVSIVPGLTAVQTGIWYAPDLRYALFDVLVESEQECFFLGQDELKEAASAVDLMTAPVLARGIKSELERLPVRFLTRVPAHLGLPPIHDNYAEGYVLKPAKRTTAEGRPILKRKIAEFDEKRFDQSLPIDPGTHLSVSDLCSLAAHLINPARLASARSKVGERASEVEDEMVLDALADLDQLFPRRLGSLTTPEEETVTKSLRHAATKLLSGP